MGYSGLQGVPGGYEGLQGVTRDDRVLQGFTGGYQRLRGVTGDYKGLQKTCFLSRTCPDSFSWSTTTTTIKLYLRYHFIKNAVPVSHLQNKIFRENTLMLKYIYILRKSIL